MGKKTNLFLVFALCLVTTPILLSMTDEAENAYYEGNDLCDSDNEELREMCEEDRTTWKMYELAWKVNIGIGLICLLLAVLLPRAKAPEHP